MSILGEVGSRFGNGGRMSLREKLGQLDVGLILLLTAISSIGFLMLYSVAEGSLAPWAYRQMVRFAMGLGALVVVALVDIRVWLRLAYPFYAVSLLLLIAVELLGTVGMGAQRWIDLGVIQLQPSELMKIALVLALARYYHGLALDDISKPRYLVAPLLMVALPVALVLKQPDLGTAVLIAAGSASVIFAAGLSWRYFIAAAVAVAAAIPIAWQFLHDYQRNRVFTFLDPERDPLGAGYHILQSKIALGAGGLFGKGFMNGTQSQLDFLPEKHTDFIFTMLGEELGLVGGIVLLTLYMLVLVSALSIALQSRHHFGRLVAIGISMTFFLYILVNTAMVMGLMPVVGVPLPLVSYGGTAMLTLLLAFGLLMNVHVHRDVEIPRLPAGPW